LPAGLSQGPRSGGYSRKVWDVGRKGVPLAEPQPGWSVRKHPRQFLSVPKEPKGEAFLVGHQDAFTPSFPAGGNVAQPKVCLAPEEANHYDDGRVME